MALRTWLTYQEGRQLWGANGQSRLVSTTIGCKNAFFNGDLEEEVYMEVPLGFGEKFGTKVCKQKKVLYSHQEPGLRNSLSLLKVKDTLKGKENLHINNVILIGDDVFEMNCLKSSISTTFEIKDLGSLTYFLDMEISRKYIIGLLKETGMSGCKPTDTPIGPNQKLCDEKEGNTVNTTQYQRMVGNLIYLSHTRSNIVFVVSLVSQFMHSPSKKHLEASTPGKGLLFQKTSQQNIEEYTDTDWAKCYSKE
ncbi:hypothetical protein CR513_01805, partial [Mucuna pruriens]